MSNTRFIGKVYHRFDELASTNDWAAQLLGTVPEGTVVRAGHQTAGRGQMGSHWQSPPGENLLLSVLFYPHWLDAQAQFHLSMAMALGLNDLIASLGIGHSALDVKSSIKWPNDLYLDDKKAAGILIQNALSGATLQSSIVGIGLNVNQLNFPPDLVNASSLAGAFGKKFDLDEVAALLFEGVERRYLQLKAGKREAIKSEYEGSLWRLGQPVRFVRAADGAAFEGIVLGVTGTGLLRVQTGKGEEVFEVKQVRFETREAT